MPEQEQQGGQGQPEDPKRPPWVYSWADIWAEQNECDPPLIVLYHLLRQPYDRGDVENKQGADFINITTIRNYLDRRIGAQRYDWDMASAATMGGAPYYAYHGRLTLKGSDGTCTKMGSGAEPLWDHQPYQKEDKGAWKTKAYGDPVTNAEASALRRACMAHGFARDLWRQNKR